MLRPDQFDLADALEAYLFANAPDFLARRLRKAVLVKQLTALYDYDTLQSTVFAADNKAPAERTIEEVALAYACLVALYDKDHARTSALLSAAPFANLKWATNLEPIELPMTSATSLTIISAPPATIRNQPKENILTDSQTYYRIPTPLQPTQPVSRPAIASNSPPFKFKTI